MRLAQQSLWLPQQCRAMCMFGATLAVFVVAMAVDAATFSDTENLVELNVLATQSQAEGHVAWQFSVRPVIDGDEISTIDLAVGDRGFFGQSFRNVNPSGQPTVFADLNASFPDGEDVSGDTQFAFKRSNLIVVPGSARESTSELTALFTGFPPIVSDSPTIFAQVVAPLGKVGEFRGTFVVRLRAGRPTVLAEFDLVAFGNLPDDGDGDVDGADFLFIQRDSPVLLPLWESKYGSASRLSLAATVPEPSTTLLLIVATALFLLKAPARSSRR